MTLSSDSVDISQIGLPVAKRSFFTQLVAGTGNFPIIKYRILLLYFSLLLVGASFLCIFVKGFTLGIEFSGGSQFMLPQSPTATDTNIRAAFATVHKVPASIQRAGSGVGAHVVITSPTLSARESNEVHEALFTIIKPIGNSGNPESTAISYSDISPSWGGQVTHKAVIGLIVFLVLIFIYIIIRFEWEMAVTAIATLVFDIAITSGIYSLIGLEVSPATVIGLLTIMGFSLYDTVVVFDKVRENTARLFALKKESYAQLANTALNQTLMRSINTTFISILPIISLLIIAVELLGVGTLKDLGAVQLVGVITGAFSSIFLATPLLVVIKEQQKDIRRHTRRVERKYNKS